MRKLFWCAVVLALTAGGGAYWWTTGEACCPCSFARRCVQYLFGKAPSRTVVEAQDRGAPDVRFVPLGGFDANGLPILEPDPRPSPSPLDLIDVSLLSARQDAPNGWQAPRQTITPAGFNWVAGGPEREMDSPMCGLSADPIPATGSRTPDGSEAAEEAQDDEPIMVPCLDDEDLPDFMPYAEDREVTETSFIEFWQSLFHPCATTPEARTETAEPTIPATRPECREDPNHPYQDGGCPYMGPGPAGRCRCPEPILPMPRMEAEPQEPRQEVDALQLLYQRLPCMMESANVEERPIHPDVDTMEFRPSDAKIKAFENWQKRLPL